MTHDNQTPAPPAGHTSAGHTSAGRADQPAQDVSLSVLTMAYPAFRFSFMSAGFHRAKWLGLRRKPADPDPPADSDSDADEVTEAKPD